MPLALLPSTGEILVALVVGLLLFGGRLPDVAKDVGRTFFRIRRAFLDLRRETGIDDTLRDLRREIEQAKPVVNLNDPFLEAAAKRAKEKGLEGVTPRGEGTPAELEEGDEGDEESEKQA